VKIHRYSALALALALSSPAHAESGEPHNQAAITLAYEGRELYNAGKYAAAIDKFVAAKQLAHSPVFDLYIARSARALGRYLDALAHYDDAARLELGADAPVAFRGAQQEASRERRELALQVPRLTLTTPATEGTITVQLDGRSLAGPAEAVALDPGEHQLVAEADGRRFERTFTVAPGERAHIAVELGPSPAAAREPQQVSGGALQVGRDSGVERGGWGPLTWTAFGVAATGVVVGATTGTIALVKKNQAEGSCAGPCEAEKDEIRPFATTATIAFVAAGVGSALGVTLLLLGDAEQGSAQAPLRVQATATGLRLHGRF